MPPPAPTTLQHAPDGVGYRLIELPDELVNSSEKYVEVFCKKQTKLTSRWTITSKDGLARLTAGGKSYAVRQKNTSNALVLLTSAGEAETQTLSAVSTVHETVELIEEKAEKTDAGDKPAAPKAKNRWHEKFGRTR